MIPREYDLQDKAVIISGAVRGMAKASCAFLPKRERRLW